jgi:hypothetical protein
MRLNSNDRPLPFRQTRDQAAHFKSILNCALNQLPLSRNFTICLRNSNISRSNISRSNIPLVDLTRPLHTPQSLLISRGRLPSLRTTHVVVTGPRHSRTSESCLVLQVEV